MEVWILYHTTPPPPNQHHPPTSPYPLGFYRKQDDTDVNAHCNTHSFEQAFIFMQSPYSSSWLFFCLFCVFAVMLKTARTKL